MSVCNILNNIEPLIAKSLKWFDVDETVRVLDAMFPIALILQIVISDCGAMLSFVGYIIH